MVGHTFSMGILGIDAFLVEVEADLAAGLPSFEIVGLPDTSVKEARDRVRAALKNCGFAFPVSRITMNLAPAHMKKEGPIYDLPLLMALLRVTGQLTCNLDDCIFVGELSLDGRLRPIWGALSMAIQAKHLGFTRLFLPAENAEEAAVVQGITVLPCPSIFALLAHLRGTATLTPATAPLQGAPRGDLQPNFADVKGQDQARRALEIAASGGHNVLLIGPPGSGKSMLAKRLPSILPDMTFAEAIETTKIHSITGHTSTAHPFIQTRPFRAPHHTISTNGLVGGGTNPRPGEISLAHNGVLFLDEFPEFARGTMEILRQPLEDGTVTIARVMGTICYPSSFTLVAAMNPCPCGYFGHPTRNCTCAPKAVARYLARISGPLLDRIDLHVEVPPVAYADLASHSLGEDSATIRQRVNQARSIQNRRFAGTDIHANNAMSAALMRKTAQLSAEAQNLLELAFARFGFSARAYDRVVKVARTIADLADSPNIEADHAAEAIGYRSLDRKYWMEEL